MVAEETKEDNGRAAYPDALTVLLALLLVSSCWRCHTLRDDMARPERMAKQMAAEGAATPRFLTMDMAAPTVSAMLASTPGEMPNEDGLALPCAPLECCVAW